MKIALPNLTLFKYSLLWDNRQWQTHGLRFLLVLISFIAFLIFQSANVINAPGLQFFVCINYINILFLSIAGMTLHVVVSHSFYLYSYKLTAEKNHLE